MQISSSDIDAVGEIVEDAAHAVIEAHRQSGPHSPDVVSPELLTEALRQFLDILRHIERTQSGEVAPGEQSIYDTLAAARDGAAPSPPPAGGTSPEDITELGEYGFSLLADLGQWADQLSQSKARQQLDAVTLPVALWVARHGGTLSDLEPVVNALAGIANRTGDTDLLGELSRSMGEIAGAAAPAVRHDLDKGNPSRPWRVLNLNRGIVATRSLDTTAMRAAFEDLQNNLPADAPAFFEEGTRQAEAMNLPAGARDLLDEYRARSAPRKLH